MCGKIQKRSGATLRHVRRIFWDHGNATVEGQDLASTYVLCPRPRTGCPDFGMDQIGVTEQRCDRAESRVLGQLSAEARLIKRKMRIGKWAKLSIQTGV